jgi:hypothetical protein
MPSLSPESCAIGAAFELPASMAAALLVFETAPAKTGGVPTDLDRKTGGLPSPPDS